ncbi:DnaB domain protein helicase [Nitzschia inconspicua]|uniref:DnaB domain protein helicase n=1 Tax=Nitzschia inconspicua TaxID=303405 RepID=A0A9K3LV78_9STRA|nr:DnaB domain protein helicase [Nitzschia inconspicua]
MIRSLTSKAPLSSKGSSTVWHHQRQIPSPYFSTVRTLRRPLAASATYCTSIVQTDTFRSKSSHHSPYFFSRKLAPIFHISNKNGTTTDRSCRCLSSSVFVSRHNQSLNVTADTILEYCQNHGIQTADARRTSTHVILRECPFCSKPTGDKPDNLYKMYISIGGGAFFCHRCGTGGSWYDWKARLGGYCIDRGMTSPQQNNGNNYHGGYGAKRYNASMPPQRHNDSSSSGGYPSGGAGGAGAAAVGGGGTYYGMGGNGFSNGQPNHNRASSNNYGQNGEIPCLPLPQPRLTGLYSSQLLDPHHQDNNPVLEYLLNIRGLDRKTLRKYGVGRAVYKFPSDNGGYQDADCVTFPWIMRASDVQAQEKLRGATFVTPNEAGSEKKNTETKTKEITDGEPTRNEKPTGSFVTRRIKARAVQHKAWQRLDPPGGGWGLFGLHTVPDDSTEIILTEGEYDAMAVSQATGMPAVSLPNGCRSLPLEVLPLLERFEKIYLWMDNDGPGQEGAEKFAKKLGLNRSYIVHCSEAKDANEALLKGINMQELLDNAALVPHDRILTFKDLRSEVLHELLQPQLYTGVPVTSLPKFTQVIKGFRRGELTVLTGPTGSGKTTFLGQVSLDLAEQGINMLWGSFEIKNTRLLHKLLKQFSREGLPASTDPKASAYLDALADRFESLPFYFMKFHGGSDVDEVLDAMEYAVYVNDVEHIVLDNMQFMISRKMHKSSFDKFEVQDIAIEKFRRFATEHNVHITLVVHPRKEDETSKLSISSFYGSAKATQEADTVIILQNDNARRKYIDVRKNRFDGTLGTSPLYFHSKSGRYVEDENDQAMLKNKTTPTSPPTNKDPPANSPPPETDPYDDLQGHWAFPPLDASFRKAP